MGARLAARDYTTTRASLDETFAYMTAVEERLLMREVLDRPVDHAIDLASGSGRLLPVLCSRASRVTAIDNEPVFIARAREALAPEQAARVQWLTGDVRDLDGLEPADAIVVSGLLVFLTDDEISSLFRRLADLLGPGGRIWNREPVANAYEWRRIEDDRFPAALYRSRRHLQDAVCAGTGLRVRGWGYIDTGRLVSRSLARRTRRLIPGLPVGALSRAARWEGRLARLGRDFEQYEQRLIEAGNAYAFSWSCFEAE